VSPYWLPYSGLTELTVDALRAALEKTTIRELVGSLTDGYQVHIGMTADSHQSALDRIADAVAPFGLAVTEAFVREWVNRAAEGAALGFITGGGGGSLTESPKIAATAGAIGMIAGGIAGSLVHEEIARYYARRDQFTGLWHLSPMSLPEATQYRFGFA